VLVADRVHCPQDGHVDQAAAQLPGPERLPEQVFELVADREPATGGGIETGQLAARLEARETAVESADPGFAALQAVGPDADPEQRAGRAQRLEVAA
jgi:hypothetical protein